MRRIMVSLLAASLLVAGAFTAVAIAGDTASAQEEAPTDATHPPARGAVLADVLGELVDAGVITESQAAAITEALDAKRAEIREQFDGRRGFHRGFRLGYRLGGLLSDGVIDADELAQLPDDHPLLDPAGPAAPYLEDGQITLEELQQLRRDLREQRRGDGD